MRPIYGEIGMAHISPLLSDQIEKYTDSRLSYEEIFRTALFISSGSDDLHIFINESNSRILVEMMKGVVQKIEAALVHLSADTPWWSRAPK